MRTLFAASTAVVLLSVGLDAQNVATIPSDFASTPGDTFERRFPFSNGVSRMMGIYEAFDLTIPNGSNITEVGFRQDEGRTSTGQSIQLEIWMGGTDITADNPSSTFLSNYSNGTARTRVFGPSIVQLPDFPSTTNPGDVFITLDTPYTYNGSENLVVEYIITANNNANQLFNYYLDKGTFVSPTSTFGTGCTTSAGQVPSLAFQPTRIGSSFSASMSRAPASSLVWLNLAFQSSAPIPGGPFGAPGCTLLVNNGSALASQSSTGGNAGWSIPVPLSLSLYHQDVYGQALIADLFGNALGFVSSNGAQVTIGADPRMATITAAGNAGAPTGSPGRRRGPVSLFRYQ